MSQSLIVAIILIGMIIVFFGGWIPMAAAALAVPMLSGSAVHLRWNFKSDYISERFESNCNQNGRWKQRKAQGASGSNAHEYGFLDFRLSSQRHGHYASDRGSSCKRYGTASQKYH